jgi:hypothetical protein
VTSSDLDEILSILNYIASNSEEFEFANQPS